jgi:hypothetical protein
MRSAASREGGEPLPGEGSALEVVEAFLAAVEAGDLEAARRYLSDGPFAYLGPTGAFERPDAYVADMGRLQLILKRIERRKVFADVEDVCVILDVHTTLADLAHNRMAVWLTVQGGRIVRIEVFLDASPYHRLFEA